MIQQRLLFYLIVVETRNQVVMKLEEDLYEEVCG